MPNDANNDFGGLGSPDGGFGNFDLSGFGALLPGPTAPPTEGPPDPARLPPPGNIGPGAQDTQAFVPAPINYGPPPRPDHLVEFPVDPFAIRRPPYMAPVQTAWPQANPGGIFSGGRPERIPSGLAGPDPAPKPGSSGLGLALVAVVAGGVIGGALKGWMGALGGAVAGGAVVNGVKAARAALQGTPEDDKEAAVSGTFALLTAGGAGYLLYKADQMESKKSDGTKATKATKNGGAKALPSAKDVLGMERIDGDEEAETDEEEEEEPDDG